MSLAMALLLGALAIALIWAVVTYNRFVALRNQNQNAFSQIDVQFKRRYDLIPNLVNATKGYLKHERETLEAVVNARSNAMNAEQTARGNPGDTKAIASLEAAESLLSKSLGKLIALREDYPELKADESVARLTEELTSTENRISFARQAFNDQVTNYNVDVESFPASLVARATGFSRAAQLQATRTQQERETVSVEL